MGYGLPRILPEAHVSDTSKFGIIFRNEKWSGDVRVVGDIWALPGTTVTVDPGTKILVKDRGDRFNLHFILWDLWSGLNTKEERFGVRNGELFHDEGQKISLHFAKLFALGIKQQPIIITSDVNYAPSPYDFNTISFGSGIISGAKISNYRRLEIGDKATIRDSQLQNVAECAVCVNFGNPSITNNIFNQALREYIFIVGGGPKISDNLFMVSKGKGIVVDPQQIGAPLIYHNNFEMPNSMALEFLGGSEDVGAAISWNIFSGGSIIRIPCDSQAKFVQNQIDGTIKFAYSGNCIGKFTLGLNYWQSSDKNAILKEKIVDREKQFEVLIPSVLHVSPSGVGRRLN